MTDIEKIRDEINRRYKNNRADGYTLVAEELDDLLAFIGSLREEPPARTQADVAESMSDLADKTRAFSAATNGQTSEQILAEMRGEETAREND